MENINQRETILARVRQNKAGETALPAVDFLLENTNGSITKFSEIIDSIGGKVFYVDNIPQIIQIIRNQHPNGVIHSPVTEVQHLTGQASQQTLAGHELANVDVGIIMAHFAVAENGAVWVTDDLLDDRSLPFICQHLAIIVNDNDLVATMHNAYERIANQKYDYGVFIAGASKTADIEQSLVLGAHGPRSVMIFVKKHIKTG